MNFSSVLNVSCVFSPSADDTGLLGTMAVLAIAKLGMAIRVYGCLGAREADRKTLVVAGVPESLRQKSNQSVWGTSSSLPVSALSAGGRIILIILTSVPLSGPSVL